MLAGLILLIIGAGGLVPGVTTPGSPLAPGGPPVSQLFDVFAVSGILTLVHLLSGAAALFCARSTKLARGFLLTGGGFYLALGFYGTLGIGGAVAEVVPMNSAGVCLSCGLGLVLLIAGLDTPGRAS